MFFLLPVVSALGSIQTNLLTPISAELCSGHDQYVTITASGISNKENTTSLSVTASLIISGSSGLTYITSQNVNIGNINPLATTSAEPSWTLQCSNPNQGVYTAYVEYSSTNGYSGSSSDEAVTSLTVYEYGFSGNITIVEDPNSEEQDYPIISDNLPTIKVETSRDSICRGSLDADESYDNMDFIFYGSALTHNYTFIDPIPDGQHTVYVKCKDDLDTIMSQSITFIIDTTGPGITVLSPGNSVLGEFTELKVSVNEEAECRYEDEDIDYEGMDEFDVITSNTFAVQLENLEEDTYFYYVKCKDSSDNIMEKEIDFEVVIPPKAKIYYEKEPPLSTGTYEIMLRPSKDLKTVPELYYEWEVTNSEIFRRDVNLVKDGSYYKGYVIIEDQKATRAGVFSFRGIDLLGNVGTEITKGATFLVDTIKPPAPNDLAIQSTNEGIKLEWYYDGEEPDKFNVYRSTSNGVGYIHYYDYSDLETFVDDDVIVNQIYYYRIAAVDEAGNIGPLSKEVSTYAKSGSAQQTQEQTTNENPPTEETRQWKEDTKTDVDTLLIDLNWAQSNLEELKTKEQAVTDLGLLNTVNKAITDVEKLKTQLSGLDELKITDFELRNILSQGDALIARTKIQVPQNLEVKKSTDIVQATSKTDIELAVEELLNTAAVNYTNSQVRSYVKEMEKLNNDVKVEVEIKTLEVTYLDGTKKISVLIKKDYAYESPDNLINVFALEVIPKSLAGSAADIDILTPDYTILNEDPVLSWFHKTLSFEKQTMLYQVLAEDETESAKNTKTIILMNPDDVLDSTGNFITGFAVLLSEVRGFEVLGVVVGVIIILGLAMYYMVVVNEVDMPGIIKKIPIFNKQVKQELKTEIKTNQDDEEKQGIKQEEIKEEPVKEKKKHDFSSLFTADDPLKTIPAQYFKVKNGDVIRGITEFKDVLEQMDDLTFYYHSQGDDFAKWVERIYHNPELASIIRSAETREDLIKIMEDLMS